MVQKILMAAGGAVLAGMAVSGCSKAVAQEGPAGGQAGAPDRTVELTIYSQDFAVVREARPVSLQQGKTQVGFTNVSTQLDQNSVIFNWPKAEKGEVVSSTYEMGVEGSGHLLKRFLGQQVELVRYGDNGQEAQRVTGTLEVADPGQVVLSVDGKYLINPPGTIIAPGNQGVVTIPQLSAEVSSGSPVNTEMGLTYLTRGLSWTADYVATLSPDSDNLALECWASVTNQTGVNYPEAKISFVAGGPNRAVQKRKAYQQNVGGYEFESDPSTLPGQARGQGGVMLNGAMAPEAVGEGYAYPLKERASIKQDQMNRVKMLHSDVVPVKRDYSIQLGPTYDYYNSYANYGNDKRLTATLAISFKNTEKGGLGMPLPGGAMRIYEPDKNASLHYIGAASLEDTPKDAKIGATLSNVFDVYAQQKAVSAKKIARNTMQKTFETVIHNEKSRDLTVRVVAPMYGKWKIVNESDKGVKLNAYSQQWSVKVPAGGQKTLKYTVVVRG